MLQEKLSLDFLKLEDNCFQVREEDILSSQQRVASSGYIQFVSMKIADETPHSQEFLRKI